MPVTRELGQRRGPGIEPSVPLQQLDRLGPPSGRDLVVEQVVHVAEHQLRHVIPVDRQPPAELHALDVALERADQDLEVLLDVGVALGGQRRSQRRQLLLFRGNEALVDPGAEVDRQPVVLLETALRSALGLERGLHLDHLLGEVIAARDPRLVLAGGGQGNERGECTGERGD